MFARTEPFRVSSVIGTNSNVCTWVLLHVCTEDGTHSAPAGVCVMALAFPGVPLNIEQTAWRCTGIVSVLTNLTFLTNLTNLTNLTTTA